MKWLGECQDKKALSLSKKPAIKRVFAIISKVGTHDSSSKSDLEIEFESDESGDDVSNGDADCLICTGLFSHDKHSEKMAQRVRCYRWAHEDCGVQEDYFVLPICRKSVKLKVTSLNAYCLTLELHLYFREK
jgi:hypothetical protein